MFKHSYTETLFILSKIFNGNRDIIQLIYNKKKEIEENEVLFYYLINGYQHERLICYGTDIFNGLVNPRFPRTHSSFEHTSNLISTLLTKYKDDINLFLSLFSLSKVSIHWSYQREIELSENQRFIMKVIIGCFCLDTFIKVRDIPVTYRLECPILIQNYSEALLLRKKRDQ